MCEQWLSLLLDTTVPLGVNFTKAVFDYDLQRANLHSVKLCVKACYTHFAECHKERNFKPSVEN